MSCMTIEERLICPSIYPILLIPILAQDNQQILAIQIWAAQKNLPTTCWLSSAQSNAHWPSEN